MAFWRKELQDTHPCFFPSLNSRKQTHKRANTHLELDISAEDLATFAEEQEVSAEAVMRLAWGLVLRSFSGMSSLCFGWQATGRDELVTGSARAVGSFANMITCTMSLFPEDSVLYTLQGVDRQLSSTSIHQYATIPEAQRAMGLKGGTKLFNSCLIYTDEPADWDNSFTSSHDIDLRHLSQQQSSPFEVAVSVRHSRGKLLVDLCQSIMDEEQAFGVASTFGQAIQMITDSPADPVRSINLFSDRDYAQLVSWASEATTPGGLQGGGRALVHELVERHAQQTPSAQAVCAWDGELTYRQLVDETAKLARCLVDAGAGSRTVIPVILDKSRWAPVALLAVLK